MLASLVQTTWTVVAQRQLSWLNTRMKTAAPQRSSSPPDLSTQRVVGFRLSRPGYDPDMRTLLTRGAVLGLAAAALVACAPAPDEGARAVAARFYAAYAGNDGAAACAQLAPRTRSDLEQSAGKPCEKAVLEEDVPDVDEPTKVQVFGTQAEISWAGETTFLARFEGGWKVMAAACTPQPAKPYDCTISGG